MNTSLLTGLKLLTRPEEIPATHGAAAGTWKSALPFGVDLVGSAQGATIKYPAIAGKPAILLDGSQGSLTTGLVNLLDNSNDFTHTSILAPAATQQEYSTFLDIAENHGGGFKIQQVAGVTNKLGPRVRGAQLTKPYLPEIGSTDGYVQLATDQWQLFTVRKTGRKLQTFLGTALQTTAIVEEELLDATTYLTFGHQNDGQYFWGGLLALSGQWNRAIDNAELADFASIVFSAYGV